MTPQDNRALRAIFCPRSVAVVGVSRDPAKLGHGILRNILGSGYAGPVYPVNPSGGEILDLEVYPSVLATPEPPELAVIVIPDRRVAAVLRECAQAGTKATIVISAGFREAGPEGLEREREIARIAHQAGMRLIGPNCLGVIDTGCPLNASFAAGMPEPGHIGFMSQSGALCTAILDWSLAAHIGFSRFVSTGNKVDVEETDLLEAWHEDPNTRVVIAYIEGIRDGPRFMDVARRFTRRRPFVALKSGTTEAGTRAVSSHTGSLAGSERAYQAAFRQSGVIRAGSVEDLFDWGLAFAYQPLLAGDGLAVVTNAGGPGIMATDALSRAGLRLASLAEDTIRRLEEHLPEAANTHNPIDVLGDADRERYAYALQVALQDPGVDGVLCILTPQVGTDIPGTARAVGEIAGGADKPVLGVFMGEEKMREGIRILNEHRLPNYGFPERAVAALAAMRDYRRWLERPEPSYRRFEVQRGDAAALLARARRAGRLSLPEAEARGVLAAYGVRVPRAVLAPSAAEAVRAAREIGFPVVAKLASPDIVHKSDVGGVRVGLRSEEEVRDAFDLMILRAARHMPQAEVWGVLVQEMAPAGREVIVGMSRDPQFGPLVMFGLGGIYVEVLQDVAFRLAPLAEEEAREMIREIRAYPLLRGVRGQAPADEEAVVDCLLRVSQLVTDFPEILEMDINPLLVHQEGAVAVDARLALAAED